MLGLWSRATYVSDYFESKTAKDSTNSLNINTVKSKRIGRDDCRKGKRKRPLKE